MNISSDINILGSMPDYNLIYILLNENNLKDHEKQQYYTKIKTIKSYKRFEKAIKSDILSQRQGTLSHVDCQNQKESRTEDRRSSYDCSGAFCRSENGFTI